MSSLSAAEFLRQASTCLGTYQSDNSWFYKSGQPFSGPTAEMEHINAAFNLYLKAATPSLGMIVLGDTKIRKDPTLVQNFGYASGNGIQEKELVEMARMLDEKRKELFGSGYVAVTSAGSILSDSKWSPLLNDSLILGGAHSGVDFVFAEDRAHTVPQAQSSPREWWRIVFNTFPDILWGDWGPRVFARELVGLKLCGYQPAFSYHQLGFSQVSAQSKSFRDYLKELSDISFQSGDKQKIVGHIGDWLFGSRGAISY